MESGKTKKPDGRKSPAKADITQSVLESVFIEQLGELRRISEANARTAREVGDAVGRATDLKVGVDTGDFERLTRSAVHEMKTQIRYLKQPPIVLKMIIVMFVTALVSVLAAGYLASDNKELKAGRDYWYYKYNEAVGKKK